ncbi:MAG TPA: 3D domain-containing protein [Candidatus Eremiobacteraceae bacterium]|nr:3D domain-containing protein [Candidatus Eremiobacteraceae bacterium]
MTRFRLPRLNYAATQLSFAFRPARRPAVQIGALIAVIFITCSISQSDAKVQTTPLPIFDPSRIVGTWYSSTSADPATSSAARQAIADAQTSMIVGTAQSMLTTTRIDDSDLRVPERVSNLHIETKIHSRRVEFDADPTIRYSAHLAPGEQKIVHSGAHGVAWVTERVTMWDDVVVNRQVLARQVVHSPTPGVVVIGTPKTLADLRRMMPNVALGAAMTMVATAYTADTASAAPTGYTATGILAQEGVVAVDPRVIPLGTKLFVPGYGFALAADTGGAIIGNRIDLCMDSYDEAIQFGRRPVQVFILKR